MPSPAASFDAQLTIMGKSVVTQDNPAFTGLIAKKLGILVPDRPMFGLDGLVAENFVSNVGRKYDSEIYTIEQKAAETNRDLTDSEIGR